MDNSDKYGTYHVCVILLTFIELWRLTMHPIPKESKLSLSDLKKVNPNKLYWTELEKNIETAREVISHAQDVLNIIRPKVGESKTLSDLAFVLARDVLKQFQRLDGIKERVAAAKSQSEKDDEYAIMGVGLDIQNDFMDFVETNERLIKPQIKDIMTYLNESKPQETATKPEGQ